MKASDISDEEFLEALKEHEEWTNWPMSRWDLAEYLGYPEKVVLAKARTMIRRRKTVDGCYCGCRGDFRRIIDPLAGVKAIVADIFADYQFPKRIEA